MADALGEDCPAGGLEPWSPITGVPGAGPAPADLKILRAKGPDDLPSVVERYANQLTYGHHRELVKVPGLEGDVAVAFEIGTDGATSKVRVVSSTMKMEFIP